MPLYWQGDSEPLDHQGSPSLYLFVQNLPQLLHAWLFLVPYSFYFVAPGGVCPGASTAAKGPRPQSVSNLP